MKWLLTLPFVFLFGFSVSSQDFDIDLARSINPERPNSGYWRSLTNTTYAVSAAIPVAVLAAGFIKNDPGLKRRSYQIFGGIAVEVVLSESMKRIFNRERPAEKYPALIFPYRDMHGHSFPSGHTSLAFATATGVSLEFKKWYFVVPAYLWAGSVGYSRMYLGVHYPTDVFAGAVIGAGSALLADWLGRKWLFKTKGKS